MSFTPLPPPAAASGPSCGPSEITCSVRKFLRDRRCLVLTIGSEHIRALGLSAPDVQARIGFGTGEHAGQIQIERAKPATGWRLSKPTKTGNRTLRMGGMLPGIVLQEPHAGIPMKFQFLAPANKDLQPYLLVTLPRESWAVDDG